MWFAREWSAGMQQGTGQAAVVLRLQSNASMVAKGAKGAAMLQKICCPNGQSHAYTHKE